MFLPGGGLITLELVSSPPQDYLVPRSFSFALRNSTPHTHRIDGLVQIAAP